LSEIICSALIKHSYKFFFSDTTDPGEDGARSALPSTELEALRSELATIFGMFTSTF
jgi:hypothetical protein